MTDDAQAAPQDGGQAAPPEDTGAAASSWTDSLGDELASYVETKGFKDPGALAESYRNLEKLRGVPSEQLLQLPADMSDAEAMAPVYDRMGRPDAPDKYTNALGEGIDEAAFGQIATEAHKLGLSDQQFQGMQQVTAQISSAMQEAQEAEAAEKFDAWKSSDPDGFNNAARLMAGVGVNEEQLTEILSGDKTALYDFLGKAASKLGEGEIIQGDAPQDSQQFNMSANSAKAKISELLSDAEFMKQYTSTNQKVRQPAIEKMAKLQEIASIGNK
jgi:hypothetical protein